jgi:hypothetical protein
MIHKDPRELDKNIKLLSIADVTVGDIVVGLANSDFIFNFVVNIEHTYGAGVKLSMIREDKLRTLTWGSNTKLYVIVKEK